MPLVRELIFHGLAFVSLTPELGSLFQPRYIQWAQSTLQPGAYRPVLEDAALISAAYAQETQTVAPALHPLHAMAMRFDTLTSLKQLATQAQAQRGYRLLQNARPPRCQGRCCTHRLRPQKSPYILDAASKMARERTTQGAKFWLASDGPLPRSVQWLSAALVRSYIFFEKYYTDLCAPRLAQAADRLRPLLAEAVALVPSLHGMKLELSAALGPHGRTAGAVIMVGVHTSNAQSSDDKRTVVQVLHEHFVSKYPDYSYVDAEWFALCALAARVQNSALQQAHERWLASVNLAPLMRSVIEKHEAFRKHLEPLVHRDLTGDGLHGAVIAERLRLCHHEFARTLRPEQRHK